MKASVYLVVITAIFAFISFSMFNIAHAQKLPTVQNTGLRAPNKIKVDGKDTEWGQYQAYNKTTEVYYSIANDDSCLYLIIKAEKANMIKKSVMAGITLTINHSDKKMDAAPVSIMFPVLAGKEGFAVARFVDKKVDITKDNALANRNADTLMRLANQALIGAVKFISVHGIKDIPDSLISIYNEDKIRAVARFDHQMHYVYELAIPLKYL